MRDIAISGEISNRSSNDTIYWYRFGTFSLKKLLEMFMKSEIVQGTSILLAVTKLDVENKESHLDLSKVKVGFMASRFIRQCNLVDPKDQKMNVSDRMKLNFQQECKNFLLALVKKLLEKSPLKYALVRQLSFLDPHLVVTEKERENNIMKFTTTLNILEEAGRVLQSSCDAIIYQYRTLLDAILSEDDSQFEIFDPSKDQLESLICSYLASDRKYMELWVVVQQILLLSHGHTMVEQCFSVNKEVNVENLAKQSLIAQRLIVDYVQSVGGITEIPITEELLSSCALARIKYTQYLDQRKKEIEKAKREERLKAAEDELADLESKRQRLNEDINELYASADCLAYEAEWKRQISLISQSHAVREKAKEKEKRLHVMDSEIGQKVKQL